jgi:hypothetical protein
MISVVVATMWRYPPFLDFVADMTRLDVIKEVIIINNDSTRTPQHVALNNTKVRMFDFGKNIFVNPAWNYGANASTADKICILNDDMIVDLKLFYRVDDFFRPEHGTIGLTNGRVDFQQTPLTNGAIGFEQFTGQSCYGFGNLFFIHRENWRDIPRGLDIWFGDVFIFEYFLFRGYNLHLINNVFHYHAESETINEVIGNSQQQDLISVKERELYAEVRTRLLAGTY